MGNRASRNSWKTKPLTDPQPIPAPDRVWTDKEMGAIRRGYVPHMMEEKWFIFMEANRLFAHRSWTGIGIYEATFASTEGGHVIEIRRRHRRRHKAPALLGRGGVGDS